jgi:hypothetical protein
VLYRLIEFNHDSTVTRVKEDQDEKICIANSFMCLQGCVADKDPASTYETVYINNGAIQCESSGLSEQETAKQLIDNGIDVILSTCGSQTGLDVPTVCGAGDAF